MYFCVDEFGYTIHRMIVISALLEELILIIPTAMYITNEGIKLSKYYFIAIFSVYLIMNICNFEYIVASKNVARYYSTGKIDLEYLVEYTGTDAIRPMLRIVDEKNSQDVYYTKNRSELIKYLKHVNDYTIGDMHYRDFNLSKYIASNLISEISLDKKEDNVKNNKKSIIKDDDI